MAKRMTIMIIFLVIVFGGLVAYNTIRGMLIARFLSHMPVPTVSISASQAKLQNWQESIPAVGSVLAVNGVNVNSEVAGKVVKINFRSGDFVKKGQSLILLDSEVDQQELKDLQAQDELNQLNYNRLKTLVKRQASAKSELDTAASQLKQTQAQVAKTKILIAQKNIKAPFAGKIGIRMVNLGQYISPGNNLVSLQSLNPLYIDFYLPEQSFKLVHINQPVNIKIDTYPKQIFHGKIIATNSQVDQATRNILIRAVLPNPNHKLLPGMFADVSVSLPERKNVLTVPQTAITYSLYGDSIFIIQSKKENDKTIKVVKRVYVKVGEQNHNRIIITHGLKAGQWVATSGQLKLNSGTPIKINNAVNPAKFKANETLH